MILLKLLRFWLPVFFYAGLIYWLSSQTGVEAPPLFPHVDKIFHGVEYGILGWLLARAFMHASWSQPKKHTIQLLAVCAAMLYGISDEYHQSFVPGRSAEYWDVLADTIGGALGGWMYTFFNFKE